MMQVADPYVSRVDRWEAVDRADPVIWPNEATGQPVAGPWDDAELQSYQSDGFLYRRELFSADEAQGFLAEAQRLADTAASNGSIVITEPHDKSIVRSIFRIHRENDLFRKVCHDPRLVEAARQLLGGDVYIHQSRINFKPALDGKEFFWHSDFETWHVEDGMPRMRAVSISLSLTENTEFNGPLMVIPGSHRRYIRCAGSTPEDHFQQSLRKQEYGVPAREALTELVEAGGIQAPKGPAGSALFFECNTMHGSVGNLSPLPRVNLFVVFNSVHNAVVDPFGDRPPRPDFLAEREDTQPIQPA